MHQDPLDTLQRPAPPPYASHPATSYCPEDGTYLV